MASVSSGHVEGSLRTDGKPGLLSREMALPTCRLQHGGAWETGFTCNKARQRRVQNCWGTADVAALETGRDLRGETREWEKPWPQVHQPERVMLIHQKLQQHSKEQ